MNQAIRARAVDPDAPIKPPAEILLRFSNPPEKLIRKAKPEIQALIDAAEIKKGMYGCCCLGLPPYHIS